MSSDESTTNVNRDKWNDETIAFLCAYLNVRLCEFLRDEAAALQLAARTLSSTFKVRYKTKDIEEILDKISYQCCDPESRKTKENLFRWGISHTTLPRLQQLGDNILPKIEFWIPQLTHENRIKCECPFTLDDGYTIQCSVCSAWQHFSCIYPEFRRAPRHHVCSECAALSTKADDKQTEASKLHNDHQVTSEMEMLSLGDGQTASLTEKGQHQSIGEIPALREQNKRLRARIKAQDEIVMKLQRSILTNTSLGSFTTFGRLPESVISGKRPPGPDDLDVERAMVEVNQYIQQLISRLRHSTDALSLVPEFTGHLSSDLIYLLKMILGKENDDSEKVRNSVETLHEVSLENLIQSLTAGAICGWAFGSTSLAMLQMNSPVLQAQRWCIFNRDGAEAVKNLHLATWSFLTEKEYSNIFYQAVEEEANTIAQRVIDIIKSLIEDNKNISIKGSSTLQKTGIIWDGKRDVLEEVFRICLDLKGQLTLRETKFLILFPPPGTVFDPQIMEVSTGEAFKSLKSAKVRLCTLPGILAASEPKSALSLEENFSLCREPEIDSYLVSKAKVLLC